MAKREALLQYCNWVAATATHAPCTFASAIARSSTCKVYILPNLMRTVSVSRGKSSVRSRPHPYSYIAGDPPKMTAASIVADSDTVAAV